jgi:hypothetical protein
MGELRFALFCFVLFCLFVCFYVGVVGSHTIKFPSSGPISGLRNDKAAKMSDTAAFAALLNELRGPLTGVAAVSIPAIP